MWLSLSSDRRWIARPTGGQADDRDRSVAGSPGRWPQRSPRRPSPTAAPTTNTCSRSPASGQRRPSRRASRRPRPRRIRWRTASAGRRRRERPAVHRARFAALDTRLGARAPWSRPGGLIAIALAPSLLPARNAGSRGPLTRDDASSRPRRRPSPLTLLWPPPRADRDGLRRLRRHRPTTADHQAPFFGVAPEGLQSRADYARMKAGGMGTVRIVIQWSTVEGSEKGVYDWSSVDQVMTELAVAGLEPIATVFGTPDASTPTTSSTRRRTTRRLRRLDGLPEAAAERYGDGWGFLGGVRPRRPRHRAAADPRVGDLERAELLDLLVADSRPSRLRRR